MEATDWIRKGSRVLGHGGGDPGMRQLKEQGTTGAKKMTASLSIRQVIEAGPKMPSTDPAARARTESRAISRSLSETKCAPFETNEDRFNPRVSAVYRNSASQSPPNVVALRDLYNAAAFMLPLESVLF